MGGFFFIVLACLLWALDTLIRYPLLEEGIDPIQIVFYEHLFLTLVFVPFIVTSYKRFWSLSIGDAAYFIIVGAGGSAMSNLFFTKAIFSANPSAVILLQKLQLIVAVVLSYLVLKEKIHKKFLFWGSVSMLGAFLISYQDIKPIFDLDSLADIFSRDQIRGYCYALVSIIAWGSATVFGKKLSLCGYNEKEIMAGRFFCGFAFMVPFMVNENFSSLAALPTTAYPKIALMVLGLGLPGVYCYYRGLKVVKARVGAIAELFFPFFAVGASWFFLDNPLSGVQIVGGCILIIGSLMIQWKRY